MSKLQPPDSFALSAAVGWLELGNAAEALAELELVSAANRTNPGILEVRWAALAELKRWESAVDVAGELTKAAPESVNGWLHRAYALRRALNGGLSQAWDALRPVADKFPKEMLVAFNLACYACQMQQMEEARSWLRRAAEIAGKRKVRGMALTDTDLKSLWPEIRANAVP